MANKVISNHIIAKIKNLSLGNDSIVVLKGIPLSFVDDTAEKIDLSNIVSNRIGYFMSIFGRRHFFTYEEFLLLADFIVSQYKEIYILDNNIYMEQYPIEECFPAAVRTGLLTHFEESDEGETDSRYIGDISEYISIFEGLTKYNGRLVGAYCSVPALRNPKIITLNVFENSRKDLVYSSCQRNDFIEIIDEADYINFVKLLFTEPDEIHIRISNYTGDANRLKDHIAVISHYWQKHTKVLVIQVQELNNKFSHCDRYSEILKRFWGYTSFRDLSVYDMTALEHGEKDVKQVSQENIIANLVEEVENCGAGKIFRDVFVTAPTGAGKSVMFQIPAIYLAEKYNLLTIVISPLIGLMNDQVKNL